MAQTIEDVREALATPKTGQAFAAGFAKAYFDRAFGSLPKSELDLNGRRDRMSGLQPLSILRLDASRLIERTDLQRVGCNR